MPLRIIKADLIESELIKAIGSITFEPDPDILPTLLRCQKEETSELAKDVLNCLVENVHCAKEDSIPLCQDTGTLVVFIQLGSNVHIEGASLNKIVNMALEKAYEKYYLRASQVIDPLYKRINTANNTPAIIHLRLTEGDQIRILIGQKGGGAENMSRLKMFPPSASEDDIVAYVLETVQLAGSKACPPLVVGIGIGGNFESCALLAKEALFQPLQHPNPHPEYNMLEQRILKVINESGIGPQGMGGHTTALAVHILTAPCHIASLPVAVNLQCHAHRHTEITI